MVRTRPSQLMKKKDAHTNLERLVVRKLTPQFYFSRRARGANHEHYYMYAEIISRHLADALPSAPFRKTFRQIGLPSEPGGSLMVMSALADSCAGTTRSRITDEGDACATLAGFLGFFVGTGHGIPP